MVIAEVFLRVQHRSCFCLRSHILFSRRLIRAGQYFCDLLIEELFEVLLVCLELFVLLFGDMQFDTNIDLAKVFLGVFLSLIVELLVEFFCFMVDYTRIENVQFEDDDYYYYVKAVPKVTVSDSLRIVKTISTSENSGADFREQVSRKVTDGSAESNE